MSLLFISFLAGLLTVFAPCVFTLLPIIIGGSIDSGKRARALTITLSLSASIIVFTLLLKVSTIFIDLDPRALTTVSGGIIIGFGLISLFPSVWDKIQVKLGLSKRSDDLMASAQNKKGFFGNALLGASLGPVFTSCSPTYALVVATILPVDVLTGMLNIVVYTLGLSLVMFSIAVFGQKFIKRFKFAANPNGLFKKTLGLLFVLVGISIITGFDQTAQVYIADTFNFDVARFEQRLLNEATGREELDNEALFNVVPARPAPEFVGLENWINSDPQTLEDLEGQVVLVDFWTYSCINCVRTQPYLNDWYDSYQDDGFTIIGVHAPEFSFEKKPENVARAVEEAEIEYPVALDNDFATWNAYDNTAWPGKYLIDAEGNLRKIHLGEGEYAEFEEAIRALLAEKGTALEQKEITEVAETNNNPLTPETYLGFSRHEASQFTNRPELIETQAFNTDLEYAPAENLEVDQWTLGGAWNIKNQQIISGSDASTLTLRFQAKEVYLVMEAPSGTAEVKVQTDFPGSQVTNGSVSVTDSTLYHVVSAEEYQEDGTVTFTVPRGVALNVFTFGG